MQIKVGIRVEFFLKWYNDYDSRKEVHHEM